MIAAALAGHHLKTTVQSPRAVPGRGRAARWLRAPAANVIGPKSAEWLVRRAKAEAPASWSAITGRRGRAEKPGPVRSVAPADANRWPADRHGRRARPWLRHSRDRRSGETAAVRPPWHRLAAAAIVCGR
jgi:hypothetical protein